MYRLVRPNPTVFRAYDIRGIIDESFDEHAFYSIGRAVGTHLGQLHQKAIFLGRDARLSSFQLAKALEQGILDSGIDVFNLGAVSTPMMYFAAYTQAIHSGLMVTGSHNPANYNGIKLVINGQTLVQDGISRIFNIIKSQHFSMGIGTSKAFFIDEAYIKRIVSDITLTRPFKVVVDAGNGIAGPVLIKTLTQLGCEVIPLFCEVDGRFPNHHPDPTVEANLVDLKHAVLTHRADIGLAFDGDADRLGVVTNLGEVIWADRLMMFYARHLLNKQAGATIAYDVKCSANLKQVIEAAGGRAVMCPTGHSIVKKKMQEVKAVFAGEMSGHLFFKDRWYGFDDALYSAARLLEMLSSSMLDVHEQFSTIPNSIHTPEIHIPVQERRKFQIMQDFCTYAEFKGAHLVRIDGLRAEFANGWGLLRASNTTPCLVARFEAHDTMILQHIKQAFATQLQRVAPELNLAAILA